MIIEIYINDQLWKTQDLGPTVNRYNLSDIINEINEARNAGITVPFPIPEGYSLKVRRAG